MKADIHPSYHEVAVTCSCGNQFITGSTLSRDDLHIEVCSECHPFYTGKQKTLDAGGRVQQFMNRFKRSAFSSDETEANDKE
jgi:large subunit ribosomal protein L31